MAFEHESGLGNAFDRAKDRGDLQGVVQPADRFIQGSTLNEAQTIIRQRGRRVGGMIAKDGDRISGAAALPIREDIEDATGQLILTNGEIYVLGDVFPVSNAVIDNVPMIGRVEIGIRISRSWQDYEANPDLLGLAPGTLAEGEPGAAHELVSISWALAEDDGEDDFVLVYLMVDGTIIDQTPPPVLEGVVAAIAIYDDEAHGSYIARGCRVTALGKTGAAQVFSIEEGSANINGFKRTRYASLRHTQTEEWNIEEIAGETHTYPGGASATFSFFHSPKDVINSILVTKEFTATVTRGPVAGTADALPNNSVTAILEVKQGATTYADTAWDKLGDSVDWSPGGAEPATGSSYTVKYQYLALVLADASNATTFTVSGGVAGTLVIVGYDYKLPRIDLLCLDRGGLPVYIKGISARKNALPPPTPSNLLKLCEVHNNWNAKPTIVNNGTRSITYDRLSRVVARVEAHERLLELERIKSAIDTREPIAKKGLFVDPFISDFYRDAGVSQNAAIGGGIMQLAIAPTIFVSTALTAPVMLNYTEEVVLEQVRVSGCMKINPYQAFLPLPGRLHLTPAVDFWTVSQTIWASPTTLEFNRGVRQDNGPLVVTSEAVEDLGERQELAEFLRVLTVAFKIEGFGASETLVSMTLDGRSVTPAGPLVADSNGEIVGSYVIPSNITAGVKEVVAEGAGGTIARAFYTGSGIVSIRTMRNVTTIERYTPRPTTVVVVPQQPISPGQPQPPVRVLPIVTPTRGGGGDPLAQTFYLTEPRQLVGVDVKLCLVGDVSNSLLVHQVPTDDGIPTDDIQAEAFVSMAGATAGWKSARYNLPYLTSDEREWAFIVKTDDALHSLAIASVQGFDTETQSFIGAQPYAVGVLLSSSNAKSWTPHQNDDLAFRVVAAKYGPLTKTVPLGSFNLVNCSDLQVRAAVELPSPDCSVLFEIVRGSGEVWRVEPYQVLQLSEFITETVQLRAILSGTEKLSPVLYAPVALLAGEIATTATYVSRAFNLGSAIDLTAYMKAALPFGSSLTVEYDLADGDWETLPFVTSEALSDPSWVENKYADTAITGTQGRLKLTLIGGPSARPRVGDLGAAIT